MQGQRTTGIAGATETEGAADLARPAGADNCPSPFIFIFLFFFKKKGTMKMLTQLLLLTLMAVAIRAKRMLL